MLTLKSRYLPFAGVLLLTSLVSPAAFAATFTVTKTDDTNDGTCNADCSLREAIVAANANADADTINFATSVTDAIALSSGELTISRNLSINGPGATNLTIRNRSDFSTRIFRVSNDTANGPSVLISGLTITGPGGGILNDRGTLIVRNCTLTFNDAENGAGIYNTGNSTLTNCTLSDNRATNGGGIFNASGATLTLSNCSLIGNRAAVGAGIDNRGSATLTNCTLGENSSLNMDLRNEFGGGLNNTGSATVTNCTFYNNQSGRGGNIYNDGSGGGGTLRVGNSILGVFGSGNPSANIINSSGTIISDGYNLSSDAAGGDTSTGPGGLLNHVRDTRNTNPRLTRLPANYGGATQTYALPPGSPAIDKGKDLSGTGKDQRGLTRPFNLPSISPASGGDNSDIGAFEVNDVFQSGPTLVVTTIADADDGSCGTSHCSLREAITAANILPGTNTVTFAPSVTGTIQLTGALPTFGDAVNGGINLQGPGANVLTVRRNTGGDYYIFNSNPYNGNSIESSISGLTISNGTGGISNNCRLTVSNCTISGNSGYIGGGIYNDGTLTVNRCNITGNNAAGGGIANRFGGTLTVNNSTLSGNTTPAREGGGNGGGIYNDGTSLSVNNCTFTNNRAGGTQGSGGAISNQSPSFTVTNSTFSGNEAVNGGAIRSTGPMTLDRCVLFSNIAGNQGGAIDTYNSTVTLTNCTISGNRANGGGVGGGIVNASLGRNTTLTLSSCTITSNTGTTAGGVDNQKGSGSVVLQLQNTIIAHNSSPNIGNNGGAITSLGYNLCSDGTGNLTQPTDQPNTDPKLGPLQNNGGPTQTHALQPGSPAIDKGKNFGVTTDQRGKLRPRDHTAIANANGGDGSDIGAYETDLNLVVSNPRAQLEGSVSSPGSVAFNITLSGVSNQEVKVNYQTANGTATAGSDYTSVSGTVTFAPGQTRKAVTVNFIGDSVAELNETLFLDLRTPVNAIIADSRGVAYIANDDGPQIFIDNARAVTEGNSGTTPQNFTVRLSAASTNTITVDWATANGTAGPADYTVANGRLTFAPGETIKTISVLVKGDTTVETTETYRVNLTRPTFAVIADSQGTGYILNDDSAPASAVNAPSN